MAYAHTFSDFTQQINLTQYAAHLGYEIDRKKTTKSSIVMRKDGDKIIVSRKGAKWVYFSVTDDSDNGTIVNFIGNRTHKSIAEIGRELSAWLGGGVSYPSPKNYVQEIEEHVYDPERIKRVFHYCKPNLNDAYLEQRGLTRALLRDERFTGRIFKDRYHNAVFPHYGRKGICGLELKSFEKNFFVKGSEKTLWRSNIKQADDCLIIGEAVIDTLSYHQLFNSEKAFYFATGGGMSPEQGEILKDFIAGFKALKQIIIITDNDQGGDKLTVKIKSVIAEASARVKVTRHSPEMRGADWNNVLNSR